MKTFYLLILFPIIVNIIPIMLFVAVNFIFVSKQCTD